MFNKLLIELNKVDYEIPLKNIDEELLNWIKIQLRYLKNNKLKGYQINRFNSLNINLENLVVSQKNYEWLKNFEELKEKIEENNYVIPLNNISNKLQSWTLKQIASYKKDKLTKFQKEQFDTLNICIEEIVYS